MRLQLLSDLHLETESFEAQAAPDAELLVLAGDIDSSWAGLQQFADWPVPVLLVAGNHEFDQRELTEAWPALRQRCESLNITLLERECTVRTDRSGLRVRFLGTTRWSDFDAFGAAFRERAQRAASYYVKVMRATQQGAVFDAQAVREEALACKAWLAQELARPNGTEGDRHRSGLGSVGWDRTVVITHYAPSLLSADPRYGKQPGTASFCNADDELLPWADVWIHGHLHCRHDYTVEHLGHRTRVVCHARGHAHKGEANHYDSLRVIEVI